MEFDLKNMTCFNNSADLMYTEYRLSNQINFLALNMSNAPKLSVGTQKCVII